MKIAIATDDFSTVTGHIGRCNGFIIYELENGEIKSRNQLENTFTNHGSGHHHGEHQHNDEHSHGHAGLAEGLKGCSHLICTAAGWRVVDALKQNNIEVLFTSETDADTAAVNFSKGNLQTTEEGVCRSH